MSVAAHQEVSRIKAASVGHVTNPARLVEVPDKTPASHVLQLISTSSISPCACKHVPTDTLKVSQVSSQMLLIGKRSLKNDDSMLKLPRGDCSLFFHFNFVTFNHNFSMSPTLRHINNNNNSDIMIGNETLKEINDTREYFLHNANDRSNQNDDTRQMMTREKRGRKCDE